MSLKTTILAATVVVGTALAASSAYADPILLGYSINGGALVLMAPVSTTGQAVAVASPAGYSITLSATGTGPSTSVPEPNFSSNTLTIKSSGAGSIALLATEVGITTIVPSFQIGFSNNPLSDTSVTEAFYTSTTNTPFALDNKLASSLIAPGVTMSITAPGSPIVPYSITELYSITFDADGGTVNATIIEKATASVPEPLSISLLGAGLAGLGVVRLRRKA